MSRYHTSDIKLTPDGDFALDEYGDLEIVSDEELIQQMTNIVLKTTNPDWFYDEVGADLEDLIGLPNTRDTASRGKEMIVSSLAKTGFFNKEDLWVEAKPVDKSTIVFILFINSPFSTEPLVYRIDLDLGSGASVRRVS